MSEEQPSPFDLRQAFSSEDFRKQGHAVVDQLADYLAKTTEQESELPVIDWESPEEATAYWEKVLQTPGTLGEDLLPLVLEKAFHVHHPHNLGHQVGTNLPIAALADLVGSLLDTGCGVYEVGSPGIPMERIVTQQLCQLIGFGPSAGGFLVSGGSLGNLTALLAAREAAAGDDRPWETGNPTQPYSILVSSESHYCVDRSTRIMGWGNRGAWKTPVDHRFRIDPAQLTASLNAARAAGRKVLGLVGNACTTATGSFDPLPELADFCQENGLWFHVDAAHGGGALFSERHRSLLDGIDRADSVVVDFHKMLLTPTLTTGVLFRQEQDSFKAFAQKAEYLWRENESPEWYNPAKRTIECTKPMLGLKVYTLLKAYGTAAFETNIDQLFALGQALAERLQNASDFELYREPTCNIVCYRHRPKAIAEDDLNAYNQWLRDRLVQSGQFYIVQIKRGDDLYLRSALMNPLTKEAHLDLLLDTLRDMGNHWQG